MPDEVWILRWWRLWMEKPEHGHRKRRHHHKHKRPRRAAIIMANNFQVGQTEPITVQYFDNNGTQIQPPAGTTLTLSVSDTSLASVSVTDASNGQITGIAPGSGEVTGSITFPDGSTLVPTPGSFTVTAAIIPNPVSATITVG